MGLIPTASVQAGTEGAAWWDYEGKHYTGEKLLTAQQALELAGLDYQVVVRDGCRDSEGLLMEGTRHVVRLARPGFDEPDRSFGSVGKVFEPAQPADIADYMGAMLGALHDEGYVISSAFELEYGKRIVFVAETDGLLVAGNDPVSRYLMGWTCNDGSGSTRFDEVDVRGVCENTLLAAIRGTKRTLRFKHTRNANARLRDSAKLAHETRLYNAAFAEYVERMQDIDVTLKEVEDVLVPTLFPGKVDENGKLSARASNQRDNVISHVKSTKTVDDANRWNAWGVYNALTEYDQHERSERDTGRDLLAIRFDKRIAGPSANFSEDAWSMLTAPIDNDDVMRKVRAKLAKRETLTAR